MCVLYLIGCACVCMGACVCVSASKCVGVCLCVREATGINVSKYPLRHTSLNINTTIHTSILI